MPIRSRQKPNPRHFTAFYSVAEEAVAQRERNAGIMKAAT